MDRISDSGSDGCGSIPHGATKKSVIVTDFFVFCTLDLFAPLVKPTEIFPVPHKCILRLEDPMVLVREDEKP